MMNCDGRCLKLTRRSFVSVICGVLIALVAAGCGQEKTPVGQEVSKKSKTDQLQSHALENSVVYSGEQVTGLVGNPGSGVVSLDAHADLARSDGLSPAVVEDVKRARAQIADAVPAAASSGSPTTAALDRASKLPSDQRMHVVIALQEPTFDFGLFRHGTQQDRDALISTRKEILRKSQGAIAGRVSALGGIVVETRWLANHVVARLPAGEVSTVSSWPEVVEVYLDGDQGGAGRAYGGREGREGLLVDDFLSSGYDAQSGGREGGVLKIGIIEWHNVYSTGNWLARDHVGWKDWDGGPTRVQEVYDCRSGSCTATTMDTSRKTHGTEVSWVALGSIEQGQDDSVSDPNDRELRSGIAKEAELYYYQIDGCSELAAALEKAVADGVDVANFSGWVSRQDCDHTHDCGGINAAVENATDAGVLFAACAGNSGHGSCKLWYPGWRSDVLSVNGLDTSDSTTNYNSTSLSTATSSEGGLPLGLFTGGSGVTTAGVGLSAPGYWHYSFTTAPDNYNEPTSGSILGCSFATPAVTGTAALLRDALNSMGWDGNNARVLMTNLFVLGDAWDHSTGTDRRTQVSDLSGYGRLHAHWPSDDNLTAPWGWGYRWFTIQDGETVTWPVWDTGPEDSRVTQWKWAFTWFEQDLDNAADIVIRVVNTCPDGGGTEVVASDWSYDLRKRVHLRENNISGKCLQMEAYGYDVPAGGRTVYSADYFHSGNPALH